MTTFHLLPEYGIPERFLSQAPEERCCIFLIACHSEGSTQQMGSPPEEITGYRLGDFQKGGMSFWFSLIHPEDLPLVTGKIIDAHEHLATRGSDVQEAVPLILRYRMKHRSGQYVRIKDSRFLLSYSGEGVVDEILCRIEPYEQKCSGELAVEDLLHKEKSCNHMLEVAVKHQTSQKREVLEGAMGHPAQPVQALVPRLTSREKEILRLVADGLSSKMIADQCCISINTVETHRRHLLEKLGVKNSMELIKEASKVFVL